MSDQKLALGQKQMLRRWAKTDPAVIEVHPHKDGSDRDSFMVQVDKESKPSWPLYPQDFPLRNPRDVGTVMVTVLRCIEVRGWGWYVANTPKPYYQAIVRIEQFKHTGSASLPTAWMALLDAYLEAVEGRVVTEEEQPKVVYDLEEAV